MGYYDFPHTRNYDTDLGYLIQEYKKANSKIDYINDVLNKLITMGVAFTDVKFIKTCDELKTIEHIDVGDYVVTYGYHTVNDGGSACYLIGADEEPTYWNEKLLNNYAYLIEPTNIKQFGAYGDNKHDDYNVFNNAISFMPEKSRLYIPNGEYLIQSKLRINKPFKLIGSDNKHTIIHANNGIQFTSNTYTEKELQLYGTAITDMYIDSAYDNVLEINDHKLDVSDSNQEQCYYMNVLMENLIITGLNSKVYGIICSKMFDSTIRNCLIKNCNTNLWLHGCDNNSVYNNRIIDGKYNIYEESINTFGSQNTIFNNDILNATYAQYYTNSRYVSLHDNYFENTNTPTYCIYVHDVWGAIDIHDNRIELPNSNIKPIIVTKTDSTYGITIKDNTCASNLGYFSIDDIYLVKANGTQYIDFDVENNHNQTNLKTAYSKNTSRFSPDNYQFISSPGIGYLKVNYENNAFLLDFQGSDKHIKVPLAGKYVANVVLKSDSDCTFTLQSRKNDTPLQTLTRNVTANTVTTLTFYDLSIFDSLVFWFESDNSNAKCYLYEIRPMSYPE